MSHEDHDFDGTIERLKTDVEADKTIQATFQELAKNMRASNMHVQHRHQPRRPDGPGAKRTANGVLVFGSDEVMEVFRNSDGAYSVCGYAERSSHSFGDFFLGMDAGPDYENQASVINKAIMSMGLADGFREGAAATQRILPGLPDDPPDPSDLVDGMLGEVCKPLFGLPDGHLVVSGGMAFHLLAPGRCPGDYTPVSGYIFLPDPGIFLTMAGRHLGKLLKDQTLEFVQDLRKSGKRPEAPLTRALYDSIPEDQNDLFARTLVGVMMGLLPTTEGNLEQVLKGLHADGSYYILASRIQALSDPMDPDAVVPILREPVMNAMQANPMPPAVWRTAVKDHKIGGIDVKAGDKVDLSIKSATLEDLKCGKTSVTAIFGGDRSEPQCPLHACPGFELAMGIIYGTLAAAMKAGR